ncbi:MAG: HAMP domain-containing protein [Nitrospirae bacterium]|nr:MAG: HAMP domain-containing protein [Nitrospirota bacterium]
MPSIKRSQTTWAFPFQPGHDWRLTMSSDRRGPTMWAPSSIKRPHAFRRFMSLRTKFILFVSLIIILVCSGLSGYLIRQQAAAMEQALRKSGRILVTNLANNSRYSLIAQDLVTLERLINAAMTLEEVVYVVMSRADGTVIVAKRKHSGGSTTAEREKGLSAPQAPDKEFNDRQWPPDPSLIQQALTSGKAEVLVTPLTPWGKPVKSSRQPEPSGVFTSNQARLYDFALPVYESFATESVFGPLTFEHQETLTRSASPRLLGIVQIGLTTASMRQNIHQLVNHTVGITALIILLGIASTILLANRVITPLCTLSITARQVSEGNLSARVTPTTHDEVGELGTMFNHMVDTLDSQLKRLRSINQAGVAIASALDVNRLLHTVLHQLGETVGFTHMLLMLYDSERGVAYHAQTVGIPEEIALQVRALEFPVEDDGSLHADLLLHGKAHLVADLSAVTHRLHPAILALIHQLGVTSFVCAPLLSQNRILGFIGADSAPQASTREDLDLLVTIANIIGVAIDNARAYRQLEEFNLTLEQQIQERTQSLQEANVKLRELDQLKSAFVSIVSHELRTPMTSIKGLVENMLAGITGSLSQRQTFYLDRVHTNINRLTRMINDLLDLSKIEAGRMELILAPLSIHELITEVIEGLREEALHKALHLETSLPPVLPEVVADRDKLHQVLMNLVYNAVKFTPPGGTIRIAATLKTPQSIEVCVSDTGCGIAPEELEHVFHRFYRSKLGPLEAKGAGLGLAITKSLIECHRGQIWVESTVGEGSRFFFTLPLAGPSPT